MVPWSDVLAMECLDHINFSEEFEKSGNWCSHLLVYIPSDHFSLLTLTIR